MTDLELRHLAAMAAVGLNGDVEHVKLLDDPYLLVARRGTFSERSVPLDQLDGAPLVAWPSICDQPRMEEAFTRAGANPEIVFRTAGNETLLSMVRAGMGSAVLPWLAIHAADAESDDRLRVHELRPAIPPREVFLHWRAGRTHSPLAARAIQIAIEVASDLADELALEYSGPTT